ncbi:twin-arginine translocation signal domain-containing protein [Mucilaginibacter limnophilus]|uniref:Twin-arginine translocation signal domain-containing protein n=1 Tax=Mucilaginibacter limnophilus TaxID=1932778 RepID=A0A437MHR2_9SPHI|nr:SGNH/GDSL hydrolase family protein [Mucilaginibacter limnophilus]RVT97180.1 twin-arginine translocation signal domain-containing protein [Mucilaginibacter limnophilus]
MSFNRRNFIKTTAAGTAAISIPSIVNSAFATEPKPKKVGFNKNDIVLFQGDSITDSGRDWGKHEFNTIPGLGHGYVLLTSAQLLNTHADKNLTIYNKGISGHKVYQLLERWDRDCIDLKPNVVSIMIGVNDFWHTLDFGYKGTLDVYKADLKKLLDTTQSQLPGVKLVIGEPFGIKGVKAVTDKWYPAFDGYRHAAREAATEHGAIFIPYQTVFEKALAVAPGSYWTTDGVHPSIAGTSLMSHAWLKAVGE